MSNHAPLCPPIDPARLGQVAQARVLYADTDKMGITYHASYLRYMELGRVEFIRNSGMPYSQMERQGLALPLTDVAVRYKSPARYDDKMTIYVGLSLLTKIRVHFDYRFVVAAGDRAGLDEDVDSVTDHLVGRPPDPLDEAVLGCWALAAPGHDVDAGACRGQGVGPGPLDRPLELVAALGLGGQAPVTGGQIARRCVQQDQGDSCAMESVGDLGGRCVVGELTFHPLEPPGGSLIDAFEERVLAEHGADVGCEPRHRQTLAVRWPRSR